MKEVDVSPFILKKCRIFFIACQALTLLLLLQSGGCSKFLNVPKFQTVSNPVEQSWMIAATPDRVYDAVLVEKDSEKGRENLAIDAHDRLVSWVVPVSKWGDLLSDADGFPENQSGRAITTVWVEPFSTGESSEIHIRRVFVGDNSPSNVGPSRGEYEMELVNRLRERVGDKTGKPAAKETKK